MAPAISICPSTMPVSAAIMLPIAEDACTKPSAYGRARCGHHLRHQRHADGELAAHAQAAQEAVDVEIPDAGREHAQPGEDGVAAGW